MVVLLAIAVALAITFAALYFATDSKLKVVVEYADRISMHNRVLVDAIKDPRRGRRPVLRQVPVEARRLELVLDERTEEVSFRG